MPKKTGAKIHIITSFYYLCNWNVPSLKGTEKAFRNRASIQKEI